MFEFDPGLQGPLRYGFMFVLWIIALLISTTHAKHQRSFFILWGGIFLIFLLLWKMSEAIFTGWTEIGGAELCGIFLIAIGIISPPDEMDE